MTWFKRLKLLPKLILLFISIGLLPMLVVSGINGWQTSQLLRNSVIVEERTHLDNVAETITRFTDTAQSDLLMLANSPNMRALGGAIAEQRNLVLQQLRQDLEADMHNFVEHRLLGGEFIYQHVRFLTADGFEFVRVDTLPTGIRPARGFNLNSRANRDFFTITRTLAHGEIYVSRIELAEEFGRIQTPYTPVMRYSTPIYHHDTFIGVLVTDVRVNGFLPLVSNTLATDTLSFLVDDAGYYLMHPDADKRYGRDLQTGISLATDFPDFATHLQTEQAGILDVAEYLAIYQRIMPAGGGDLYWVLVSLRPNASVLAFVGQQLWAVLLGVVLVGGVVSLIAVSLAQGISRPITQLTQQARAISAGNFNRRIAVHQSDEIGNLALTFNTMSKQLQDLITTLEQRVQARTRDLQLVIDVSKEITTLLTLDALLPQVALLTAKSFNLYFVSIFLYDAQSKHLKRVFGASRTGKIIADLDQDEISLYLQPSTIARAARQRQVVLVHDARTSPDFRHNPALPATRSELAIPILFGTRLLGIFDLQDSISGAFGDDERRIMGSLAEQIGIAIRNTELYAQAQDAAQKAEQANQVKTQFLASISHELRTPLSAILGFAQIMENDSTLSREKQQNIQIILKNGEHLLRIIDDILEMSKIEAGQIQLNLDSFDLHASLESIITLFKIRAESQNLHLSFVRDEDVPRYIICDEVKLRQVLTNLIANAIKYTERGQVTVHIRYPQEKRLYFAIEDTGCGIEADEIDHLFNAFIRGKQHRTSNIGGTGLGLPISRQFVRLMGGDIAVSSVVGQGSRFWFEVDIEPLPTIATSTKSLTPNVVALMPYQATFRILVVEDNWDSRALLSRLLEPMGFEVLEAVNGQEAIELATNWKPHLIFMDMLLPVVDGYEATRIIRQNSATATTPIIAMTATTLADEHARIRAMGCDDVLCKPFLAGDVLAKIEQYTAIQFQYQAPSSTATAPTLEMTMFASLEMSWLRRFQRQVMAARQQHSLQMLKEIEADHPQLYAVLYDLLLGYQFEQIINSINAFVTQ